MPFRRLRVAPEVIANLLDVYGRAAETEPAEERCGFLIGTVEAGPRVVVYETKPATNRHADPAHAFEVDSEEIREAQTSAAASGLSVVGFWCARPLGPPAPQADDARVMKAIVSSEIEPVGLLVGQGAGRRPVIRAYVWESAGPREVAVVV